jgi:3-hydroxybutyryl-CoA dehydrogenase
MTTEERNAALGRIKPTTELADLTHCQVIVEAILENFELKATVIKELDALCGPDAIFATDTSSISVTQIAATSDNPARVVSGRLLHPAPRTLAWKPPPGRRGLPMAHGAPATASRHR